MEAKKLIVDLCSFGYSMEVDIAKKDCNVKEAPHWHLCSCGRRIGKISASGHWIIAPHVRPSIKREAEDLTHKYSSEIYDCYKYNAEHGYEW